MSHLHTPRLSVEGIRRHEEAHRPTSGINVGEVERYASAVGGTILAIQGLRRGTFGGMSLALLGGSLIYRGVTGHCSAYGLLKIDTSDKHQADPAGHIRHGHLARHSVTVGRPASDLYAYWREVENAPKFMNRITKVEKTGESTSHWVAQGPLGTTFEWDSEIIVDEPGRLIAWKSLPGAAIEQAGTVRFEEAPDGRGTSVTVELNYEPPAGSLGLAVARLLGEDPDRQTLDNLHHFKQLMETGPIPKTEGRSTVRSSDLG